jgi:predicted lipoprotein with Yx(FWY)xxD motif
MHPSSPRNLRRSTPPTLAACVLLALAAAACSSSSKTTSTSATSAATSGTADPGTSASTEVAAAIVEVKPSKLGKVLVDDKGRTLYLLTKDTATKSTCTGPCATAWPPLTVTGTPTAGAGVTGTITTIKRADGTTQVVIGGHPVYTYAGDSKAGDTSGQEVAHVWYAVTPQGTAAGDES